MNISKVDVENMMDDPDVDRGGIPRRSFVKGMAVAGVGAAALAGGVGVGVSLAQDPCDELRTVEYVGAKKMAGPAPRGLPLLPVTVGDDGVVRGRPSLLGEPILGWYRYCGHGEAPGLQEGYEGDEVLRYFVPASQLAGGADPWFRDRLGEPVRFRDLEPGRAAAARWRSEGAEGKDVVTVLLMRVRGGEVALEGVDRRVADALGLAQGLVAMVSFCTHFCCVPGYRNPSAGAGGSEGDVFCSCHGSVYDPYTLARYRFVQCTQDEPVSPLEPGEGRA